MPTNLKRFTISVSDEVEMQLDRLKQARYYNTSKNKMVQDLISIGIAELQKELDAEETDRGLYLEKKGR